MKTRITLIVLAAMLLCVGIVSAQEQAKPVEGKLYFSFISSAYFMEKNWGKGMPLNGVKNVAEIAHSNGIPVTWLVNAKSAEAGAVLFTEYHEKYGDEVGLMITANQEEAERWGGESYFVRTMKKDKLKKWAEAELAGVKKALPWADVTIGGSGYRSKAMVEAFQEIGLKALWGHCWEQTLTDGISDRGAPWGFYYVNPAAFKTPNPNPGGLVAIEWTARDLNNAFRTGKPETYSTDPNDVHNNNLVRNRNIDYWKGIVNQYKRNAKYNAVVPLMVHQEAHEMECTPGVICTNDEEKLKSTSEMLDELFKYVKSAGVEIVTASKAVEAYRAANSFTPPTYALFKDVTAEQKNKEIFIYFDKNGQLFFDAGKTSPILVRNYIGITDKEMNSAEFAGIADPPAASVEETVSDTVITLKAKVVSDSQLAYGLAFWGDYAGCSFVDAKEGWKVLGDKLAFVPVVLEPGENEFDINLDCKDAAWNQ